MTFATNASPTIFAYKRNKHATVVMGDDTNGSRIL
jgi:hypothetical protein